MDNPKLNVDLKINVPKTPQSVFLKEKNEKHEKEVKHVEAVKYIDKIYSPTFIEEYFSL